MDSAASTATTVAMVALLAQAALYAWASVEGGYAYLAVFVAAVASPVVVFVASLLAGVGVRAALVAGLVGLVPLGLIVPYYLWQRQRLRSYPFKTTRKPAAA